MIDIVKISNDSFFVYIGDNMAIENMSIAIMDNSTTLKGNDDALASRLGKKYKKQFIVCHQSKDVAIELQVFQKINDLLS